eukprot:m.16985 g.16985  ORF g.16985 m.16985 type:complete len:58 (-) comp7284_c0_seq2:1526-1699(-)
MLIFEAVILLLQFIVRLPLHGALCPLSLSPVDMMHDVLQSPYTNLYTTTHDLCVCAR